MTTLSCFGGCGCPEPVKEVILPVSVSFFKQSFPYLLIVFTHLFFLSAQWQDDSNYDTLILISTQLILIYILINPDGTAYLQQGKMSFE